MMHGFCRTYTGRAWDLLNPDPANVDMRDIVTALSRQARFNGHTIVPYMVAQHAVLVAQQIYLETRDPMRALCGLHHDDDEAYLGDLIGPIKKLPEFAYFRELCDRTLCAVATRLGLLYPFPDIVAEVDKRMCGTEQRDLGRDAIPDHPPYRHFRIVTEEIDYRIQETHDECLLVGCMSADQAARAYLRTDEWLREKMAKRS